MQETSFLGVYSLRVENAKGNIPKTLYFVWSEDSGTFKVQLLNAAYKTVGDKRAVGPATFKLKYVHEPSILAVPVNTSKPWLNVGKTQVGNPGGTGSAPLHPTSSTPLATPDDEGAVVQTERYMRDVFKKSIKQCSAIHDKKAAILSIKNIIAVEEGIVTEHKFMFADFGIALRKSNLLELSLSCCKRVLDLAPSDDHAHFNAARILFEMGMFGEATQHLLRAQLLNPTEKIYQKMLDHIQNEQRRQWRPQKQASVNQKNQSKRQRAYR